MTRKLNYTSTYQTNNYIIVLERINNNIYGNPRFKASIIRKYDSIKHCILTYNYTFTGHYLSERLEAYMILKYHIEELRKKSDYKDFDPIYWKKDSEDLELINKELNENA